MTEHTEVAIIGAGPIGLEAALAASEAGLDFLVLEAASSPAANVRDWGHVRLFTPWSMNVSPRARARLTEAGLDTPDGADCPTGGELFDRLLGPLAGLSDIADRMRYGVRVTAIARDGLLKNDEIGAAGRRDRPFRILVEDDVAERVILADVVLDCSGTYHNPNALGSGGIAAPGERRVEDRIIRRIPDLESERDRFVGKRVLVVGAGHSAQTVAVAFAELLESAPETQVEWAIRSAHPPFEPDPHDLLTSRADLHEAARDIAGGDRGVRMRLGCVVESLSSTEYGVVVRFADSRTGQPEDHGHEFDWIIGLTGAVGDRSLYGQLQVHECWATSGPMKLAASLLAGGSSDCLDQVSHGPDVLRNPEPDFFVLGVKSYGRTNSFLLRVGWEQVDDVFSIVSAERADRTKQRASHEDRTS